LFVLNSGEGGATLSACELIDGLTRRGHNCFVVMPPGKSSPTRQRVSSLARDVSEVFLPWWNKNYKAKLWKRPLHYAYGLLKSGLHAKTISSLAELIKRWSIDIVHTNTSLTIEPALAARATGRPHVWHLREQMGSGQLFQFWLPDRALARTVVTLADAVVANSEETASLFRRQQLGERVTVVHNGVNVDHFAAIDAGRALRRSWGVPDGAVLVAMVAHMTSRMKRHDVFVRAVAEVARAEPEARFAIVGADPSASGGYAGELEYTRMVKDTANELGLESRILYTGAIDDVPAVMNALDVMVYPSDRESFGRVAVEAMAAAKPVICANGGGLREIVVDGETGYLAAPGDHGAFAARMLDLVRDASLRSRMGAAGLARARSHFSTERTTGAIESIYRKVLA
jgi:glycosyltransferase involved in cell wall biosynthesis